MFVSMRRMFVSVPRLLDMCICEYKSQPFIQKAQWQNDMKCMQAARVQKFKRAAPNGTREKKQQDDAGMSRMWAKGMGD
jgi:hypothetical protein